MSLGLLFSGQGAQHAQMLAWLTDTDAIVPEAKAALGVTNWRSALCDAKWATCNRHAQILLTGLELAAWARLAPHLPEPAAVAGYSVGELAAFSVAGVYSAATALSLAAQRAKAMDECAMLAPGSLVSISGLQRAAIDGLCRSTGAAMAIHIDDETFVVGGTAEALAKVMRDTRCHGARTSWIQVAVASHTPSMGAATAAFRAHLNELYICAPRTPLYCNANGDRIWDVAQASDALARQISHTVRWADTLEAMHARRLQCVLEVGPGNALATTWNKRFPDVPARSADDFRSVEALLHWVDRTST
jgi:[acyl-carrier-protein] S-malonyltransferase